jgi:Fe-S oxidoreductase
MHDDFVTYAMWWGYSLVLGIFFITMPYSRYMHIPTEILLIFFRRFGIQPGKWHSSFSDAEVHSCSRCGVCIDVCQLNEAGIHDSQAVYFIRDVRDKFVPEEISRKCMVCGRCQEACPVGISVDSLRLIKRRELVSGQASDFSFLQAPRQGEGPRQGDVVYFSGCMSQLTPSITRAMKGIMEQAAISFIHLDEDRSVCCGRPLKIAGKDRQAHDLIEFNKKLIRLTHAKLLVTSCPICYRVFREEYNLPIRIQHHSQFILDMVKTGKIALQANFRKVAYHDPCDLGRGSGVYEPPRDLLLKISEQVQVDHQGSKAFCCGGSLGLFEASQEQRNIITSGALDNLMKFNPEIIATACPLCKKTFEKQSEVAVKDIAELIYASMPKPSYCSVYGHSHQAISSGGELISA